MYFLFVWWRVQTEAMHVFWVGRLSCARDVSCVEPLVLSSHHKFVRGSEHIMCPHIRVSGILTCIICCTIRPNPKWTDVACYITWYQFMRPATAQETQNNLVQLQPTPSVGSDMLHIGVDNESFATGYTEDTEGVSWLDPFLIYLELVHSPLLHITLCFPPVL
jgi:hypothetical protein